MSYEQKNEIEAVQPTPKALEYITTVSPIVWICGVLLGLMAFGALPVSVGVFLCVGAFWYVRHIDAQRVLEQQRAAAASYVNVKGPVMVCSVNPNEGIASINARADEWRENLKLSGNPYWEKIPIIKFPYTPILYGSSQLSFGWNEYLQASDSKRHSANMEWCEKCPKELRDEFKSAVLPAPKMET